MIAFEHVTVDQIKRLWPVISEQLAPSVRVAPDCTMTSLWLGLTQGPDRLMHVTGDAYGFVVFEVTADGTLWTKHVAGRVMGGTKARLRTMRSMLAQIEAMAAASGCKAHMASGREWRYVLTDYQLTDEGYRKDLTMAEAA